MKVVFTDPNHSDLIYCGAKDENIVKLLII